LYSGGELTILQKAYGLFDLKNTATAVQIKTRYRQLIKEWHPDRWMHDPDKKQQADNMMRAINAAYDLIETAPLQNQPKPRTQPFKRQDPYEKCRGAL